MKVSKHFTYRITISFQVISNNSIKFMSDSKLWSKSLSVYYNQMQNVSLNFHRISIYGIFLIEIKTEWNFKCISIKKYLQKCWVWIKNDQIYFYIKVLWVIVKIYERLDPMNVGKMIMK